MRAFRLTLLFLFIGLGLMAQPPAQQKPLKIGIGLSGASYVGDLNVEGESLYRFYPGMGFSLQFSSEKLVAPQLNTGFGRFISQNRDLAAVDGITPNTFVETPFFYVDFRLRARFLRETAFNPYFSVGIGMLGYTPKDANDNNLLGDIATRAEGETYGSLTAGFPMSLGTEIQLSHLLGLGLEYTYRLSASDYLDNISQLGTRDGKDKVQSLMLSLYITFDPNRSVSNKIRGKDS